MTRLPGHVHLNPAEHRSWIRRIAEFATQLHSVDLPAPTFRPWTDSWIAPLGQFQVPAGARKPAVWRPPSMPWKHHHPRMRAVFLHCDYLPVNLLWSRGKITGLTDWNGIHRGSRAIDVGQCRRYLASLYSPELGGGTRFAVTSRPRAYLSTRGGTYTPYSTTTTTHQSRSARQVAGRRPVDLAGHDSSRRGRRRESAAPPRLSTGSAV